MRNIVSDGLPSHGPERLARVLEQLERLLGPTLRHGYLWWTSNEPFRHFFAAGYAGQSLTVVPHLELVAVTTGDEARLRPGWQNARWALLETFGN